MSLTFAEEEEEVAVVEEKMRAGQYTHYMKSWTQFFDGIRNGKKKHDLRRNDRDFKVGDFCILEEYDFAAGKYTGRRCKVLITWVTSNQFPCAYSSAVLDREYCILSLELIDKDDI